MANEYARTKWNEQARHLRAAGMEEARLKMVRAAEELEKYGYDITISIVPATKTQEETP